MLFPKSEWKEIEEEKAVEEEINIEEKQETSVNTGEQTIEQNKPAEKALRPMGKIVCLLEELQ